MPAHWNDNVLLVDQSVAVHLLSLYHLISGRIYLFYFYDDKIAPLAAQNT